MPVTRLASSLDIIDALPAVMDGQTRMTVSQVVARLRSAGVRLPKSAQEAGDQVALAVDAAPSRFIYWDDDDEIRDVAGMLDGVVLTHRLTEDEVGSAALALGSDVVGMALDHLLSSGAVLPGGRAVEVDVSVETGEVGLPLHDTIVREGWRAGTLLAIRFAGGRASLEAVTDVPDADAAVADLRSILVTAGAVTVHALFDRALAIHGFREPVPPLSELLVTGGFGTDGQYVAQSVHALRIEQGAGVAAALAQRYGLSDDEVVDIVGMLGLIDVLATTADIDIPADEMAHVARLMTKPWLVHVLAEEVADDPSPSALGLAGLAERLLRRDGADRIDRATAAYLAGRAMESLGDPLAAEQQYQQAVRYAAGHRLATFALAVIAADRGQYATALRLVEDAEAQDDPLYDLLHRALDVPGSSGPQLGRNEPCWCGSGRKYKACHGRAGRVDDASIAATVMGLALRWAVPRSVEELAAVVSIGTLIGGEAAEQAVRGLIPDLALFDLGGLADYLEHRADLIPADTAAMVRGWLQAPRSLFEVGHVRPDGSATLCDIMTGDRFDVTDPTGRQDFRAGTLLLTWIAAVGDTNVVFTAVTIPMFGRDAVIELLNQQPDPVTLVELVARLSVGPTMTTPEGDPLRPVVGTFTTTSPARLRTALDAALDIDEPGRWSWNEPTAMGQRVLGTVRLDGKTLTVESMSEPRFGRLVELLDGLDVPLLEKDREVGARFDAVGAKVGGPALQRPDDPELLAAMADHMRTYEQQWLDESIPALGGLTPRQAADDPTRRGDLVRLLDSFGSTDSPYQMDGGRLGRALGLP